MAKLGLIRFSLVADCQIRCSQADPPTFLDAKQFEGPGFLTVRIMDS